jgi:hypothetical protein
VNTIPELIKETKTQTKYSPPITLLGNQKKRITSTCIKKTESKSAIGKIQRRVYYCLAF